MASSAGIAPSQTNISISASPSAVDSSILPYTSGLTGVNLAVNDVATYVPPITLSIRG